jgi:hypothetical protein
VVVGSVAVAGVDVDVVLSSEVTAVVDVSGADVVDGSTLAVDG